MERPKIWNCEITGATDVSVCNQTVSGYLVHLSLQLFGHWEGQRGEPLTQNFAAKIDTVSFSSSYDLSYLSLPLEKQYAVLLPNTISHHWQWYNCTKVTCASSSGASIRKSGRSREDFFPIPPCRSPGGLCVSSDLATRDKRGGCFQKEKLLPWHMLMLWRSCCSKRWNVVVVATAATFYVYGTTTDERINI